MELETAFGEVVRTLREEKGMSQERLAVDAGRHRTYISLIERGQKSPSLATIFKLAGALQTSPPEMLKRAEEVLGTRGTGGREQ